MRSKTRILNVNTITSKDQIPEWSYDGSSTNQSTTSNSEIILKPEFFCQDPFKNDNSILVLCSTWKWVQNSFNVDGQLHDILQPTSNNFRQLAQKFWQNVDQNNFKFGIEQEYLIIQGKELQDIHNPHYCTQGSHMKLGRELATTHLNHCLKAGLDICGFNSEVVEDQWEYQLGVANGLDIADQLWISRYILYRLAEIFEVSVSFDPKPSKYLNGNGGHVNISTTYMRHCIGDKDVSLINNELSGLQQNHKKYIKFFGQGNYKRLTGLNETSQYSTFTHGIGNRSCSVRIATQNKDNQRIFAGYLEDRRPSANMDPYIVCPLVARSIDESIDNQLLTQLVSAYNIYLNQQDLQIDNILTNSSESDQ